MPNNLLQSAGAAGGGVALCTGLGREEAPKLSVFMQLTKLMEEAEKYLNQGLRMTQKWRSILGIVRSEDRYQIQMRVLGEVS